MFSFEAYQSQIWRFILARGIPAIDAEDVYQEVWLSCWQACKDHENPPALLFRIARNKVADYWRRLGPQIESRELDEIIAPKNSMDLDHIMRDLTSLMEGARLKDEQATALILHHILGYSARECACILEISEETVRSRLKHARKKVRKYGGMQETRVVKEYYK